MALVVGCRHRLRICCSEDGGSWRDRPDLVMESQKSEMIFLASWL